MTKTVQPSVTCKDIYEVVVDLDAALESATHLLYRMALTSNLGPDELRSRLHGVARGVRRWASELRERGDAATADEIGLRMERLLIRMDHQAVPANDASPRRQLVRS